VLEPVSVSVIRMATALLTGGLTLSPLLVWPVAAGPVVCRTSLEAPEPLARDLMPVEVTRCAPVERTFELMQRRFFTWTAPYERGVDLVHQFTDLFGLAVAGDSGTRLMGFGFPDQTVIWDATAVGATTRALMEEQSPSMPLRTRDLDNGFGSSLASEVSPTQPLW